MDPEEIVVVSLNKLQSNSGPMSFKIHQVSL